MGSLSPGNIDLPFRIPSKKIMDVEPALLARVPVQQLH